MAELVTDPERSWAVDGHRLEEIALLTRLMVEATSRSGSLAQADIDELLEQTPATDVQLGREAVPHPRRGDGEPGH
jgi:hypothetical protein